MISTKVKTLEPSRRRSGTDEQALHALLHRFALSRLRDRCDSDDLVQETFVRLYDYRRRRTVDDTTAFCLMVASNLIRDRFRRMRNGPDMTELADTLVCPQPRADETLLYRQRIAILSAAIAAMPPLRREVFLRRRLDGDTVARVANDLEMSPAAIEKHVTRALADLRHALDRRDLWIGARA